MAEENGNNPSGIEAGDIVFDCPHCAKSIAIDARGAGLMINCPDCAARIQVPYTAEHPQDPNAVPGDDAGITDNDIVFDCPHCGKNLVVEARGAGLMIPCPDCHNRIQVPDAEAGDEEAEDAATDVAALRQQRDQLRKARQDDRKRFQNIAREMGIIQASMDRVMAMVQDSAGT